MISPTNPVFQRELLGGLRSPRLRWILLLYVVVPFAIIASVWPADAKYYGGSDLAARVWDSYFFGQLAMVLLLTPVFAAYTVSAEFQQGTAEFLWTTLVPPRAIIRGKMFAVVLMCIGLLSASLASLSIVFYLGGVDVLEMLAGFALLVLTAACAATIAVFYSAKLKKGHVSLFCTYGTMAVLVPLGAFAVGAFTSVTMQLFDLPPEPASVIMAGSFCFLVLVGLVFAKATPVDPTVGERARPNFKPIDNPAELHWRRKNWPYYLVDPMRRLPPLPDGGNVVARQEPRVHPLHRSEWGYRCASVMGVLAFPLMIVALLNRDNWDLVSLRASVWWITLAITAGWTVLLHGVSMTMDQEMGTLADLRLTNIRPREFLIGKWLGSLRMRWILLTIGVVTVAGTFIGTDRSELSNWLAPVEWWLVIELVGFLAFAVSSFCARTMLAVSVSVAAVIALAVVGSVFLAHVTHTARLGIPWDQSWVIYFPLLGLIFWLLAEIGTRRKWNKE